VACCARDVDKDEGWDGVGGAATLTAVATFFFTIFWEGVLDAGAAAETLGVQTGEGSTSTPGSGFEDRVRLGIL
jgi:hypothetical protein